MSGDRGDKEFILDMFLACNKILGYVRGMSLEEFKRDSKTVDAVIRNIEVLGEAVKNISDGFKKKYPNVEWREIAKTRDKFIHFYFGLDEDAIWEIVVNDIPALYGKLRRIIDIEDWWDEIELNEKGGGN